MPKSRNRSRDARKRAAKKRNKRIQLMNKEIRTIRDGTLPVGGNAGESKSELQTCMLDDKYDEPIEKNIGLQSDKVLEPGWYKAKVNDSGDLEVIGQIVPADGLSHDD